MNRKRVIVSICIMVTFVFSGCSYFTVSDTDITEVRVPEIPEELQVYHQSDIEISDDEIAAAGTSIFDGVYADEEDGFEFAVPSTWHLLDEASLKDIQESAVYGIVSDEEQIYGDNNWILVSEIANVKLSDDSEELMKVVSSIIEKQKSDNELYFGEFDPVIEEQNGQVYITSRLKVSGSFNTIYQYMCLFERNNKLIAIQAQSFKQEVDFAKEINSTLRFNNK